MIQVTAFIPFAPAVKDSHWDLFCGDVRAGLGRQAFAKMEPGAAYRVVYHQEVLEQGEALILVGTLEFEKETKEETKP